VTSAIVIASPDDPINRSPDPTPVIHRTRSQSSQFGVDLSDSHPITGSTDYRIRACLRASVVGVWFCLSDLGDDARCRRSRRFRPPAPTPGFTQFHPRSPNVTQARGPRQARFWLDGVEGFRWVKSVFARLKGCHPTHRLARSQQLEASSFFSIIKDPAHHGRTFLIAPFAFHSK
jgi:hypothetical protein